MFSLVTGSIRSASLILLLFSPLNKTITHVGTYSDWGPHQFTASSPAGSVKKDYVYTTSIVRTTPYRLDSWRVKRDVSTGLATALEHVNNANITSASCYITIPPPYTHVYSTGGPTGEVHEYDQQTGGFGKKIQQFAFVPEKDLDTVDKSPSALLTGAHGLDISSEHAFAAIMGTDAIEMFKRDLTTGRLTHLSTNVAPRPDIKDAYRHVKVHPNGKILYGLTEDSNYIDVYEILPTTLRHVSAHSILPPHISPLGSPTASNEGDEAGVLINKYRGDTLVFAPPHSLNPDSLIASTRGNTSAQTGWLAFYKVNPAGYILSPTYQDESIQQITTNDTLIRFETPTSGGIANTLDVRDKSAPAQGSGGEVVPKTEKEGYWIVLTDDEKDSLQRGGPMIRVYEWDGWKSHDRSVRIAAQWPAPGETATWFDGASHALWLD
ncbi:hypothetical protein FA15DRAFT_674272 [Coprinopsis marcescibilis]|uniref:Muconate cycloisomerase 1 n=1 Tax=Coprinopsis marcescibilis TaxID=230819 RepID=A0A5C3KHL3_COPMA|nr:hypothetical protein FA15DRAFT_674272 [Coprinopsis marcescibilis]